MRGRFEGRRTAACSLVVWCLLGTSIAVGAPVASAALGPVEVVVDPVTVGTTRSFGTGESLVAALPDGTAMALPYLGAPIGQSSPVVAYVRSSAGSWAGIELQAPPSQTNSTVFAADIEVIGPDRVAAVWARGTPGAYDLWASVVRPSSGTATPASIVASGIGNPNQLRLAAPGDDGSAVVLFERARAGGGTELASARLDPILATWGAPFATTLQGAQSFTSFDIGSIGGGRFLAIGHSRAFENVSSRPEKVQSAVLEPGASTWSAPLTPFDEVTSSGGARNFNYAIWGGLSPGAALLMRRAFSSSDVQLFAHSYSAATATWSGPVTIASNVYEYAVEARAERSGATVALLDYPAGYTNGAIPAVSSLVHDGLGWSAPSLITQPASFVQTPVVALAPDGGAAVQWYDGNLSTASRALRNGPTGSWSQPEQLGPGSFFNGAATWRAGSFIGVWKDGTRLVARVEGAVALPQPRAALTLSVPDDQDPLRVLADASGSTHESAARQIARYEWSWDGETRTTTTPTTELDFRQGGLRSVRLRVVDDVGEDDDISREIELERQDGLVVELTVDRPVVDQDEDASGPVAVNGTVTVTVRNVSDQEIRGTRLTSLRVDRTAPGQPLAVTQTGGADPGTDGLPLGTLSPDEERVLTATFRATDDAEVEFSAMVAGTGADGAEELGVGRTRWSVRPKYLVGFDSEVVRPAGTALLPAGDTIRLRGVVRNKSNSATLVVGPPYPTLGGNAGVMSLTYDAVGSDPRSLVPADRITLGPGESREFTLRVLTAWSDPRRIEGDNRHGGTFATLEFTPYGSATLVDGTERDILADEVLAATEDRSHRVGIDDSIEIPALDPLAFGGGVLVGSIEGVWNATVATLWGIVGLVKLPYTTLRATSAFQSQVWSSFTDAEREAFANDAALMTVAVLIRNAEFGRQNASELFQRVKASTLTSMTDMANDWQVGDYAQTTRLYSRFASDAIAQVAVPIALGKLAKSPLAAAALTRAQQAIQNRMAPLLGDLASIQRIEQVGPILNALESGLELLPEQLAVLYGITPEELTELQKLATKYSLLLTVRARHESSIEWIQRFQAMLKPEAIKIKSVSELDTKLGYRPSDLGSLVFRKPEPLRRFDAGEGDFGALVNDFVRSKGFVEGTGDWENAVRRVLARAGEWRKHEKYYKQWDKRGWIDVSFNYEGNHILDPIRKGPSGLGIAPVQSGKYVGFRLRSIGPDEYVVEMLNNRIGRFVPVTGDIDPIAFTHLDGSPLTMSEHAALVDDMRVNPLLQSQHPESTTFVKGGVPFIVSQFKPNEPGLQIAPGNLAPRVVRVNPDKSRWANPRDYHLHWDGGFVYSGSFVPRGAQPAPSMVVPPIELPPTPKPKPLPKRVGQEPNVGRCLVTYTTAPGTPALIVDSDERIAQVVDGRIEPSPLADQCFESGPAVQVASLPMTGLIADVPAGATTVEVPEAETLATAGSGLEVGQEVVVGAGTPNAETATIAAFGSIVFTRPLRNAHAAGELVVVTKAAPPKPVVKGTSAEAPRFPLVGPSSAKMDRLGRVRFLLGPANVGQRVVVQLRINNVPVSTVGWVVAAGEGRVAEFVVPRRLRPRRWRNATIVQVAYGDAGGASLQGWSVTVRR